MFAVIADYKSVMKRPKILKLLLLKPPFLKI